MSNKKISFFTSPIGLGHATRDAAIASYLSKKSEIKFITGQAAAQLLADTKIGTVCDVYVPPKFKIDQFTGNLQSPIRWMWSYYQYYKNCKKLAKSIIESDSPDIVVSDEDFAALCIAQNMKIKNVLVTDILNTKFANRWPGTAIESKMNKSMCSMIKQCNMVIMPENQKDNKDEIHRLGPITRTFSKTREELRDIYNLHNKKTILVTVGGTDAGIFLLKKALYAIDVIKKDHKIYTIIVLGPSINTQNINIQSINNTHKDIKIIKYVSNLHEYILAADILISLAGRSTIQEAASTGTPSIFIPIKGHFEQEQNAAENGGLTATDANRLEDIIIAKLAEQRGRPISNKDTSGAKRAAELILSL